VLLTFFSFILKQLNFFFFCFFHSFSSCLSSLFAVRMTSIGIVLFNNIVCYLLRVSCERTKNSREFSFIFITFFSHFYLHFISFELNHCCVKLTTQFKMKKYLKLSPSAKPFSSPLTPSPTTTQRNHVKITERNHQH
jgi:hypothetical protein